MEPLVGETYREEVRSLAVFWSAFSIAMINIATNSSLEKGRFFFFLSLLLSFSLSFLLFVLFFKTWLLCVTDLDVLELFVD